MFSRTQVRIAEIERLQSLFKVFMTQASPLPPIGWSWVTDDLPICCPRCYGTCVSVVRKHRWRKKTRTTEDSLCCERECSARVQSESAVRECSARVQCESAAWECSARVQHESAARECSARVQCESAMRECNARVQCESAVWECNARVQCESALREAESMVYARSVYVRQGQTIYLQTLQKYMTIHATVFVDKDSKAPSLPPFVQNHGILDRVQILSLLRRAKVSCVRGQRSVGHDGKGQLNAMATVSWVWGQRSVGRKGNGQFCVSAKVSWLRGKRLCVKANVKCAHSVALLRSEITPARYTNIR